MIQIFIIFALFASAISVNKLILQAIPPILFVGIRMMTAGILLTIYHHLHPQQTSIRWHHVGRQALVITCLAISTMYAPSILKAYGLQHMVSSKLALIASLDPFITALYGYLLWNQRLTWKQVAGVCAGCFGVFIMIYMQADTLPDRWFYVSLAECAALGSVCISRLGWIGVQQQLRSHTFQPAELNTVLMLIGGACGLITAWLTGEIVYISNLLSWKMLALIAYTVIVGNMISYTGYGRMLRSYSVTLVSLAGLLIPLFVHAYGPLLLGESISPYFFISLGCVGLGLWLFTDQR